MKGEWMNTDLAFHPDIEHPCIKLGWCPYGMLVEEYPFSDQGLNCKAFGHDCPAHYLAEGTSERYENAVTCQHCSKRLSRDEVALVFITGQPICRKCVKARPAENYHLIQTADGQVIGGIIYGSEEAQ